MAKLFSFAFRNVDHFENNQTRATRVARFIKNSRGTSPGNLDRVMADDLRAMSFLLMNTPTLRMRL